MVLDQDVHRGVQGQNPREEDGGPEAEAKPGCHSGEAQTEMRSTRDHHRTCPALDSIAMDLEKRLVQNAMSNLGQCSNVTFDEVQERLYHLNKQRTKRDINPSFTYVCSNQRFQPRIECHEHSRYRSVSGRCNNLANREWGSINQAMVRLIPNAYADGIGVPRGGLVSQRDLQNQIHGSNPENCGHPDLQKPLPNVRRISTEFHPDSNLDSGSNTLMVMQFGQYLDHDITFTVESSHAEDCCSNPAQEDCFPIWVPAGDPFFGSGRGNRKECINFARSTQHCPKPNQPLDQMNTLTAFVDASHTYGSFEAESLRLRTFSSGKLRTSKRFAGGKEFLPVDSEGHFYSGDIRGTEMPGLASVHTMFLREHNRIARELKTLKPQLGDEELFQSSRRILIAQWQNIVYGEYLPVVLGPEVIKSNALDMSRSKYNPKIDPTTSNAFATAAFRFGHTQIQGLIHMMSSLGNISQSYRVRDQFFSMDHYLARNGEGMEELLHGLIAQRSAQADRFVSKDVTNFLFPGIDLVARNIQRGRDHGLPGYNAYREMCGLERACSWSQVPAWISTSDWNALSQIYEHPNDIDLFVAGLAENHLRGGIVGPTFGCILANQFKRLKFGDRFFFSHSHKNGVTNSFTRKQFNTIRVWTQGPSQIGNLKDPEPHSGQHPFSEIILEELPNGNGIYFIERGNRSQFTHISLCALESAAKNNPYHHVYFLLDKPQTWDQEEVPGELQLYPNVHFHRIDFSQILWRSRFVHVKDVLELSRPRDYSVVVSILILYLRGGAFLHFDTVQVRPFPWYKRNIFPLLTARPMQIIPEVLMFQARNPFLEQFFQIVALWTRNTHSDPPMFGKIRVQELPHNKGIYFLEFSPNSNFNYVKLCALESAARLNPQHPVFLLLHSTRTDLRSLPSFLRQLDNLHVHKVDFDAMILESPFAEVFPEISENLIEYYSDIIRMLILYHKGGAYFDLDAIQIRPVPFDKVPNSIPLLSQQTRVIQNSVLLFQAGNPFLAAALDRIPTCVHLSHWGPCGLRLLEYLLLVKCTLVGAKTSSERFICPPSYQVQIFSHSDLFVLDTTRALDALGNVTTLYSLSVVLEHCSHPKHGAFRQSDLPKLDLDVDRGTDFAAWEEQWDAYYHLSGPA
eukprot:maker-scaffold319_size207808-snap-gene-1.16 protein:Tk00372 transcript:maker-scaffold319_size207808-snap-gene-1.16-mRNA-1 annotation:"peroxinectin "